MTPFIRYSQAPSLPPFPIFMYQFSLGGNAP